MKQSPLTLVSEGVSKGMRLHLTFLKTGIRVEAVSGNRWVRLRYPADRSEIFSLFDLSDLPDEKHFLGYQESLDSQATLTGL